MAEPLVRAVYLNRRQGKTATLICPNIYIVLQHLQSILPVPF